MRTQCAHVPKAHIAPEAYRTRMKCSVYRKSVTIYISIHPLNRLYLKAIQEMLKLKNDWI